MTLAQAIAVWLKFREKLAELDAIANSTLENQRKIAALWSDKLGHRLLSELRKSDLDIAVAQLAKTRRPVTLQADVSCLAQILNWCEDEGFIDRRPRLPTIQVDELDHDLPPDAAFMWMLQNVTPSHHGEALEFMLLTGLAPHELERLQRGDYNMKGRCIEIGLRDDFFVKTPARRRRIPLNVRAMQIWERAVLAVRDDPEGSPFPSVEAMEKAIQRTRQRAQHPPEGIEQVTPKMMRKWFSSKLASGEVAEHVLQRLLGHRPGSKITRKHYVRAQAADIADAVDGLDIPEGE